MLLLYANGIISYSYIRNEKELQLSPLKYSFVERSTRYFQYDTEFAICHEFPILDTFVWKIRFDIFLGAKRKDGERQFSFAMWIFSARNIYTLYIGICHSDILYIHFSYKQILYKNKHVVHTREQLVVVCIDAWNADRYLSDSIE